MAKVLHGYFGALEVSDVYSYGYGPVRDFLAEPRETGSVDWVITNPPFRLAEEFVQEGLRVARQGVAILARSVFLEGIGRYDRLFRQTPPSRFAQFTERVPMVRGRLDEKASTATGYAWLVWERPTQGVTQVCWIPPCRKHLERPADYSLPPGRPLMPAP